MQNLFLLSAFSLIIFSASVVSGQAQVKKDDGQTAKLTFIAIYSPGPSWIKGKSVQEQPLKEHFQYMVNLFGKGIMKFAGPFGNADGGAVVFEAPDSMQAAATISADPAVKSGVMVPVIRQWELVQWDKYLKK